jgi:hypothetical protein
MTKSECQPITTRLLNTADFMQSQTGVDPTWLREAADEIDRLSERVLAYKGQVESGAAEIAALKARVAELEAALQKDNSHG